MTTFDLAAADSMLKIGYEGSLFDGVVTHTKVWDFFKQNSNVRNGPQGKYIEGSHMFGLNEGVGARSENGYLPVPGNPTFTNSRVYLKKNLAVTQMTRNLMANAVKSKAAFAGWADVELVKTEKALLADDDRQAIGYGSGIICRVDTGTIDATLEIDAPYGLAGNTKGWLPGLRRGMRIVFGPNADGSALRSAGASRTILSVDKAGNAGGGILTLSAAPPADVANSDYIFRGDDLGNNAPESGTDVEMQGLLGMIDDGTILPIFQNISRDDFDEWKAQAIDASAAPYAGLAEEVLFMRAADDAEEYGGGNVTHFLCSKGSFRNVFVQMQTQLGYGGMTGPRTGEIGTKGIKVWIGSNLVEIRGVPKIPIGYVFGLDASTLWRYHLSGFEWDDTAGGSIWKQVGVGAGVKDAFYAYGRQEMELGCSDPQKNVVISGIDETVS